MAEDCLPISADGAIAWLQRQHLPSVREAVDRLWSCAFYRLRIYALYYQYFPRQYARSPAPAILTADNVPTKREAEFFRLVNDHLFPLPGELWEEAFMEEGVYPYIPLTPMGIDWSENLEDWPLPVQVFASLFMWDGGHGGPDWDELLGKTGPEIPRPTSFARDRVLNWKKFTCLCRRAGGLMAYVPPAMDVVAHDTGNLWLDISYEDAVDHYTWDRQDIDALTVEWQAAQAIMDKADRALEWLERDPRELGRVVSFWNRCMEVRQDAGSPSTGA